ncbi:hypothetical protein ACQKL5_05480 [Peribacillus sp. NPDC097675]|uniref:hypothetical protein n=1 Tax=Peribacillus sp. NPDC097675 TaxID=3390618 RepID=UPI003D047601
MNQYDSSLRLLIEDEFPDRRCVGGKYSITNHTITLYKKDMEIQLKRLLGSLERFEEYAWIIFAHEMGHALDPDLPVLSMELHGRNKRETLYQIELNAWNIAEGLIRFINEGLFIRVRDESLSYCTNNVLVG